MELKPREPPGRKTRKLRAYATEIGRLRLEGYTIEAIRKALEDAGQLVGWSSVQREAARHQATTERTHKASGSAGAAITTSVKTSKPVNAEKHFEKHIDNPLFRRRKP